MPSNTAMEEEQMVDSCSDDREDQDMDDLSSFDAHTWALNHLEVEIKDEPKDLSEDLQEWNRPKEDCDVVSTNRDEPDEGLESDEAAIVCGVVAVECKEEDDALSIPSEDTPVSDPLEIKELPKEKPEKRRRVRRKKLTGELWVTVITEHGKEKPKKIHTCEQCAKVFSTKGNLNHHLRSHSGEQPYVCQVCGRRFSFNCNLNTHLLTHSGTRPFKCEVCEKCFGTKGNLRIHSRIHTGEKPFECPHCQKGFTVKDNLSRHLKTHQNKT